MNEKTRQSWIAKALALSFILLILLGNAWFVHFLTGQKAPLWMSIAFEGLVSLALMFSVALGVYALVVGSRKPAVRGSEHGIHPDR